jgi:nanoRNase/pAp phosphatase (c-di-AMP/oligoRNAs hydrolase)
MRSDLQKIVTALQRTASVAILSHIHPEGDTIGSALGCHLTLKALGKEVATFRLGPSTLISAITGFCRLTRALSLGGGAGGR